MDRHTRGTTRAARGDRGHHAAVAAGTLVLLLSIWLSSGTLSPYAATLPAPLAIGECQYLFNIDHPHFQATFKFLQGEDRTSWEWSVVLRRILYPVLAFPFMALWGFELGGFIANALLHVGAFVYFASFVRRTIGAQGQWAAIVLLSTYPGIAYWVGLPYSYAAIVPGMLLSTVLLCKIDRSDTARTILGCCTLLGLISVAYDLLPYLGPAVVLMLILKRQWLLVGPAAVAMALPMGIFTLVLSHVFSVPLENANSGIYRTVLTSYLDGAPAAVWWQLIREVPSLLWHNWIYSNFFFLPLLFMALLPAAWRLGMAVGRVEGTVLCAALFVFLLNNMAPPYPGWQMRGTFIPRLYQPIFGVLILFCCRTVQAAQPFPRSRRLVVALVIGAALGNASITYGPALGVPLAEHVYHNFYRHGPPNALSRNLKKHGRRPRGFCDETRQMKRARRRAARRQQ